MVSEPRFREPRGITPQTFYLVFSSFEFLPSIEKLTLIFLILISVIMPRTRQNADDPDNPAPPFNLEQMATFLQNLQQAAGSSNRQTDCRRLLREFREHNPPTFDGRPDPAAVELWVDSVEKKFAILDIPDRFRVEFATYLF